MTHTPMRRMPTDAPARRTLLAGLLVGSIAAAALAATTPLQAATLLALQSAGSEIAFVTRQMGVPVEGRFTRFSATLAFDPARPQAGSVAITIDTASARFGSAELDTEVPEPTWLHAGAFPQASFTSSAIAATATPGRYDVRGRLSIKGAARELTVPVQFDGRVASGSFTLRRLDFKVGEGEWADTALLADEVLVRFKLAFAPARP
jgi:polyisoprenoid-binding protein YceI